MNLKERGITVGDLLIIIILIISTTILVKSLKKDNQSKLIQGDQVAINYKQLIN